MKIKAVFFDNDGTISDTTKCFLFSMNYVINDVYKKNVDTNDFIKYFGLPTESIFNDYACDNKELADMANMYKIHNDKIMDRLATNFKGINKMLQNLLENGYRLAIVTSKLYDKCLRNIILLGLADYFEFISEPSFAGKSKPAPDTLLWAVNKMGVLPEESVFVGDSPYDMLTGRSAGCKTINVAWGPNDPKSVEEQAPGCVDAVCVKPEDMKKIINTF